MRGPSYAAALGLLLAAFLFRVGAQLLQLYRPTDGLPPFAAWHSGALPYPWLVALQLLTAATMLAATLGVATRRIRPRPTWGRRLRALGLIYFGFMLFRLVSGLTFLSDRDWFAAPLPSAFHLVLAAFILVLGRYHSKASS